MPVKSRREREKAALREAILSAARMLAAESGWGAVTIRKIADRVEYSPPIVYEYFDDKDALLLALLVDGFRQLLVRVQAARAAHADPDSALVALTTAYLQFARENPELYQVMNGMDGISINISKESKPVEMQAVAAEVMDAVAVWAKAYGVTFTDLHEPFYLLWGTLHGLVTLDMTGRITSHTAPNDEIYLARLAQQGLQTFLRGWKNQNSA